MGRGLARGPHSDGWVNQSVIPGRRKAANPETITTNRGYGSRALGLRPRPGMTRYVIPILETPHYEGLALLQGPCREQKLGATIRGGIGLLHVKLNLGCMQSL